MHEISCRSWFLVWCQSARGEANGRLRRQFGQYVLYGAVRVRWVPYSTYTQGERESVDQIFVITGQFPREERPGWCCCISKAHFHWCERHHIIMTRAHGTVPYVLRMVLVLLYLYVVCSCSLSGLTSKWRPPRSEGYTTYR